MMMVVTIRLTQESGPLEWPHHRHLLVPGRRKASVAILRAAFGLFHLSPGLLSSPGLL